MKQNNKKKQERNDKKLYLVLVLLLCISVGFAVLSTTLNIAGNTTIKANSWSIHFANATAASGSATGTVAIDTNDNTKVDFSTTLTTPGDKYEFTIDIVNDGSIDAELVTITPSTLTTEQAKYLTYTYTYVNGDAISAHDGIHFNQKSQIKVTVQYKKDIATSDLPSTNQQISCSLQLEYQQAPETGVSYTHSAA